MNEQLLSVLNNANELADKASSLVTSLSEINIIAQHEAAQDAHPFVYGITIFILACFVGYYVVWKVTPSLHTPLMSVTNAISGIVIVGALISASSVNFGVASAFGFFATFLAAINIFGGFIVTQRMLEMFKKK